MEYSFQEVTIEQLIKWIDQKSIDLNPSYQRNFIWSPLDQQSLMDSVLLGYPLPNFFVYKKPEGKFEMVDGQQRSKTIYRFVEGIITSSIVTGKQSIKTVNRNDLLKYRLPFIQIEKLGKEESMKDFYVLINKKGKQLNIPEVHKSEFHDTLFMKLANDCLSYQNFIELDLFTDAANKRMNDRDFVQELLGYLKEGIMDKKKYVEDIFEEDISEKEYDDLTINFKEVIDIIYRFNIKRPIKQTRYKQRNDFYTLFTFINENKELSGGVLDYQYEILLVLNRKDEDGQQFIRPTNSDCLALKDYATNCVSQSNSKNARLERLRFFNSVLKNTNTETNHIMNDVLRYLSSIYGNEAIKTKVIGKFELLNIDLITE